MTQLELSYHHTSDEMHEAFDQITAWLREQQLPTSAIFKVRVIAEELMSNVVRHGEQKDDEAQANVRLVISPDAITFTLSDTGIPFNPIENKDLGYGLMITNGSANNISYEYLDGKNVTTVKVNIE